MLLSFILLPLASALAAFAANLEPRQTNTNARIATIVSAASQGVWRTYLEFMMERLAQGDLQRAETNVDGLINAYGSGADALINVAVSSGSATTIPTDVEIHTWFVVAVQQTCTGLSGLSTSNMPGVTAKFSDIDRNMSRMINGLDPKLPGTQELLKLFMLDGRQFCDRIGFTATLAAMGF
ncbi:hypothetical protein BDV98DRAFT_628967 [Pterulicium gracile]|uniref:Uncharacterized protein n=1 Tax=Pterulicium gracile TaxID=1884261 RepID=A0A5C3QIL4_9AGAR|nr:hypothetical protein BDV98DRAFT_628967 [Pterula gracilis]